MLLVYSTFFVLSAHLLLFFLHLQHIYKKRLWFSSSSCLRRACCLFCFCGCSELRSRWERLRDEHLSSPPFPCCPASRLPVCWGDWDAAGSFLALIAPRDPIMVWFVFLQPGLIFHISNVNAPSNSPPYTFDEICTICLWREWTDWQACFSLALLSQCKWFDQAPAVMGASSPILRQYYVPKIAWLEIMKAYDFFFFFFEQRSHPERGGDRDLTKDVLTRPLLPNQLPEVEIGSYGHQRKGQVHLITSSLMSVSLPFLILSHCWVQ